MKIRAYGSKALQQRPAQLAEHWASIPKVVDSILIVEGVFFSLRSMNLHSETELTAQTSYSPEYSSEVSTTMWSSNVCRK